MVQIVLASLSLKGFKLLRSTQPRSLRGLTQKLSNSGICLIVSQGYKAVL